MQDQQIVDPAAQQLDFWAYVEIFGHTKTAGRISERKMGVNVMIQVDVPNEVDGFSHSELYSPTSIFSIKPTTEDWCRKWIKFQAGMRHDVLPYIPEARQIAAPSIEEEEDN